MPIEEIIEKYGKKTIHKESKKNYIVIEMEKIKDMWINKEVLPYIQKNDIVVCGVDLKKSIIYVYSVTNDRLNIGPTSLLDMPPEKRLAVLRDLEKIGIDVNPGGMYR